ncbi:diadenylate cyclase [Candidatus Phytoplasma solani]|uniref:diadenylate cyclase n=1 Tax=Candidatus Phytoplasma solani TaxID=69896 RepID=UPI0032DA5F72
MAYLLQQQHTQISIFFRETLKLTISEHFYYSLLNFILTSIIIIKAPYIRNILNNWNKYWNTKRRNIFMGGDFTQKEIVTTVMELSSRKIGALITIEKNNILEQYAQKAILINGDVSKELLLNIFTPNTPLHDGAVIIRGDKILCASTYYTLSSADENFDKKTGSRHRAALGISETTDSMTIVVSEETGNISIALEGMMIKINEKTKLQEYLAIFMN